MSRKLLTIGVPTYNRHANLGVLLHVLQTELADLEDLVEVIVSDNASTDKTPEIAATFARSVRSARIIRNSYNLGADGNIGQCVREARSKYVWIIGDDDAPKSGVIRQLLSLLKSDAPDLVYLRSEWVNQIVGSSQGQQIANLRYRVMERLAFATLVNTWFTFISGIIFNKEALLDTADESVIQRYSGTNFVQLGWVLNILKLGSRFIYVHDRCVLATASNTGGYAVISTFGANYSQVVADVFGHHSSMARKLIRRHLTCYLPALAWQVRFTNIGKFHAEDYWPVLRRELGGYWYFWLVVAPICYFPKSLAWPFLQAARVVAASVKTVDRVISSA